jgi:hypothetical protein
VSGRELPGLIAKGEHPAAMHTGPAEIVDRRAAARELARLVVGESATFPIPDFEGVERAFGRRRSYCCKPMNKRARIASPKATRINRKDLAISSVVFK